MGLACWGCSQATSKIRCFTRWPVLSLQNTQTIQFHCTTASHYGRFSRLLWEDEWNILSNVTLWERWKCSLHLSDASVAWHWTWPSARPTPIAGTLPQRWPWGDSSGLRWSAPGDRSRPPLCVLWPREWCRGRCVPSPPESCRVRKTQLLFSGSTSRLVS